MEGPHKAANTQQNSALNINQPRQHNNAYERQANQQKFNKFLDLYLWLSYKTFVLYSQKKKPERLSWHLLYRQFGSDPAKAGDKGTVDNFRTDALRELRKLKLCWPGLDYATPKGFLEVRGCMPSIPPQSLPPKAQGLPQE